MRSSSRATGLACAALALGCLLGGCTQAGDPVVTVMLVKDAGTGGATGQIMQPVDAGSAKPPMTCAEKLPQMYSVFSGVIANECQLDKNDPLALYLESIERFARDNPPGPMPGESRGPAYCDAAGMPYGIYQDDAGLSYLCPAACDSLREYVRMWSAQKTACDMAAAAAAAAAAAGSGGVSGGASGGASPGASPPPPNP